MQAKWKCDSTSAEDRCIPVNDRARTRTARRWEIWAQQAAAGKVPCFATELRFNCEELHCPWREECQLLRAEWRR